MGARGELPGGFGGFARGLARDAGEHGFGREPSKVRQRTAFGGAQATQATCRERFLEERPYPLRPDHIRGEQHLHRARDAGRCGLAFGAEHAMHLAGDLLHRFCSQLERQQQIALSFRGFARNTHFARAVDHLLRAAMQFVELLVDVDRGLAAGAHERREEGLGDFLFRSMCDLADVPVVLFQGGGFLAFEDCADDQHDRDHEHDPDPGCDSTAHHQRVPVSRPVGPDRLGTPRSRPRSAGWTPLSSRRRRRWTFVVVEERHALAPCRTAAQAPV